MRVVDVASKAEERFEVLDNTQLEIQLCGNGNDYMEKLRQIVKSSPTGSVCVERYADFIEGNGFNDVVFSELEINHWGETTDDLHSKICQDMALFGGFALHLNYNVLGEVTEIFHIPFECCRLGQPDDMGNVGFIAYHPDWTGKKTFRGKIVPVDAEHITFFNIFNSDPRIVQEQIEACGGIEYYKGQILWCSTAGKNIYPTPKADRVITEMSTDEGISNVQYRNARCNFLPAGVFVTRKGDLAQIMIDNPNMSESDAQYELKDRAKKLSTALKKLQGDASTGKLMHLEADSEEDIPKFIEFKTANYDKDFSVTSTNTTERIYSAFGQESFYCLRIGKVGFGGDVIEDAFSLYNSTVRKPQRFIERVFRLLFSQWQGASYTDFSVEPLKYISSKTTDNGNTALDN